MVYTMAYKQEVQKQRNGNLMNANVVKRLSFLSLQAL